jgi:hypothetical protein
MSQTEGNAPMNTTHPDALPREQRELNALLWAIAWRCGPNNRHLIVNGNGETVLSLGLGRNQAEVIVREHNRLIRQVLETA